MKTTGLARRMSWPYRPACSSRSENRHRDSFHGVFATRTRSRGLQSRPGRSEGRGALVEALDAVVWDRLPRGGVGDVGAPTRTHTRVLVEGAHSHRHLGRVVGIAAEQVRAALRCRSPSRSRRRRARQVLTSSSPCSQRNVAPVDSGLRRDRAPGPLLAARAVAVAGVRGARRRARSGHRRTGSRRSVAHRSRHQRYRGTRCRRSLGAGSGAGGI